MKTDQYKTEKGVVCSACGTRLVKPWPDNEKGHLYCPRHRMMIPEWMAKKLLSQKLFEQMIGRAIRKKEINSVIKICVLDESAADEK